MKGHLNTARSEKPITVAQGESHRHCSKSNVDIVLSLLATKEASKTVTPPRNAFPFLASPAGSYTSVASRPPSLRRIYLTILTYTTPYGGGRPAKGTFGPYYEADQRISVVRMSTEVTGWPAPRQAWYVLRDDLYINTRAIPSGRGLRTDDRTARPARPK